MKGGEERGGAEGKRRSFKPVLREAPLCRGTGGRRGGGVEGAKAKRRASSETCIQGGVPAGDAHTSRHVGFHVHAPCLIPRRILVLVLLSAHPHFHLPLRPTPPPAHQPCHLPTPPPTTVPMQPIHPPAHGLQVDTGVINDATLEGAQRIVVLHAIACMCETQGRECRVGQGQQACAG